MSLEAQKYLSIAYEQDQGCGLGRDVSVSRRSRDVLKFRLGLGSMRLGFLLGLAPRSNVCLGLDLVLISSRVSGHFVISRRFVQAFAVHTVGLAAIRAILTSMTFVA